MNSARRLLLFSATTMLLGSCTGLPTAMQTPYVELSSFRMLPAEGLSPRFAIGIRVVNPNPVGLPLRGMSYEVDIEGHRLLTGVAGDLKTVPAYGESLIEIVAGINLLGGLRLFNDLLADRKRDSVGYSLRARLDAGRFRDLITLEEKGELPVSGLRL